MMRACRFDGLGFDDDGSYEWLLLVNNDVSRFIRRVLDDAISGEFDYYKYRVVEEVAQGKVQRAHFTLHSLFPWFVCQAAGQAPLTCGRSSGLSLPGSASSLRRYRC